ncbi:MAG: substrate-binding domain-containing protein [Anaerolineales bacterium]
MGRITARNVLSLVFIAGMLLTACAPAAPAAAPTAAAPSTSNEQYIYVSAMGNLEFFNAHKYGWKWAGQVLGVKATYVGPATTDAPGEVAAFDQAIAMKPAGICVFAFDPSVGPDIDKASAAGIPVVTILGDLPNTKRIAYVGSDEHLLGYVGGTHLAQAINGQGKVAILTLPGTEMFDEREAGFRDAFKNYPGIQVVQRGDTKADTATAISVAKDILTRYPDLAAFVGTDSTAGIGAATAVKEAGLSGKVKTVAMDRNSDVLQAIKNGDLTGTVAQDDAAMAFWAMLVLYEYRHNQAPLTMDNAKAGVQSGPYTVFTSANYIDQSNLQYFLDANSIYTK